VDDTPSLPAHPDVVIITGASAGIGKVTALHLAERGYAVIGTSRRLERLESLFDEAEEQGVRLFGVELDPNSDESVQSVMPGLISQFGRIDALVNNAGFGVWGPIDSLSIDELKLQFEANFFGAVRMVHSVLPQMMSNGSGRIVNISSVLGRMGTPFNGAYVSSKFALEGISESLKIEVQPFGVRVAMVQPGLFRTNFSDNSVNGSATEDESLVYAPHIARYNLNRDAFHWFGGNPVRVAKVVHKVITSPSPNFRYPVGIDARAGMLAARLLPERIYWRILSKATMRE
jgi:short-subunit dehydrogenase